MSVIKRYNISEANTLTKPLNLQDITVDAGTEARTFTYDASLAFNGINSVTVNPVTASIDENIKSENIKKGITILGVEGSSQGNMLEKMCLKTLDIVNAGDFGTATYIPDRLFQQQSNLRTIYFPKTITSIGAENFSSLSNIRFIRCLRETPPSYSSGFTSSVQGNAVLITPINCEEAYKNAASWKTIQKIYPVFKAFVNDTSKGSYEYIVGENNITTLKATPTLGNTFVGWYNVENYFKGYAVDETLPLTYENIEGVTYPFEWKENLGYYESTNKGKDNTASLGRFRFTTDRDNLYVIFKYINYGESTYDYGIISKLDTALGTGIDTNNTTDYTNFSGQQSEFEKELAILVPTAGEHFIDVKFRKDSSQGHNNDSLRIKGYIGYESETWDETDLITTDREYVLGDLDLSLEHRMAQAKFE